MYKENEFITLQFVGNYHTCGFTPNHTYTCTIEKTDRGVVLQAIEDLTIQRSVDLYIRFSNEKSLSQFFKGKEDKEDGENRDLS